MTALLVMVGGAVGAAARYLTDHKIQSLHSSDWPWGTLVVNWLGSFVLGLISGASTDPSTWVTVGVIGAFTTWSTFIVEIARLSREDGRGRALGYLALSLIGGVVLAFCGNALTA